MSHFALHVNLQILLILTIDACSAWLRETPAPTTPSPSPALASTPAVSPRPLTTENTPVLASPTFMSLPHSTAVPQPPVVSDWSRFALTDAVSIEYPASWTILQWGDERVDFRPVGEGDMAPVFTVILEVYQRPLADRAIADPHTWEPNEGGYEIHWEKPIAVDSAEGLEFVWGVIQDVEWETLPALMAVLYSEEYELDVRLTAYLDGESIHRAEKQGLAETIAVRFAYFEHMVQSVRFGR